MEHRRYGKLRLGDYKFTLAGIGGIVLLAVACFVLDCGLCYSVYLISFAAVWVALIVWPYLERFTVEDHLIVSRRFRHVSEIVLPPDSVLVFTQADIRDTFSVQSYFLKGKYAVSILSGISLENILQTLHANRARKYTNASIENSFSYHFLYSFVYEQDTFAQIVKQGVSRIVIPESLTDQFDIKTLKCDVDVLIDLDY